MMKSRKSRLAAIIEILSDNSIGCQDELSKHLAKRGYIVTQATLSRDLKKLRTMKVANDCGGYRYVVTSAEYMQSSPYAYPGETSPLQSPFHPAALQLRLSGNVAVIKTRNGYASGIAYDLDSMQSDLILGTIPGADTVIVVLDETAKRSDVLDMFATILPLEVVNDAREQLRK